LLRSFPHDNLAGHRMLAMLAEGNQDWEMALDHMNRCIEIAPDDALNYVKKADYLEKLGWKEEAVTVILEARSRFPDDRTVLGSAVRILSGAGRGEEMMSHLQEWARAHPNDTRILEAIESLSRDSQAPPGPGSGGGS
jgi:tetratricopeptide (TPR) repeat protein